MTLYALTAEMQAVENALIENGGELTPEIEETLGANEVALQNKADGIVKVIRRFETNEDALDAEIKRLTALKKTCTNARTRLKDYVRDCMVQHEVERIECPLGKFSLRNTPVVELDEDFLDQFQAVKAKYCTELPDYVEVDFKVSKTAIKEHLAAGEYINGAAMGKSTTLQLR